MYSVLGQIGPCRVNVDSNPTRPANWSWNENSESMNHLQDHEQPLTDRSELNLYR
jgi:hypothetical protein